VEAQHRVLDHPIVEVESASAKEYPGYQRAQPLRGGLLVAPQAIRAPQEKNRADDVEDPIAENPAALVRPSVKLCH